MTTAVCYERMWVTVDCGSIEVRAYIIVVHFVDDLNSIILVPPLCGILFGSDRVSNCTTMLHFNWTPIHCYPHSTLQLTYRLTCGLYNCAAILQCTKVWNTLRARYLKNLQYSNSWSRIENEGRWKIVQKHYYRYQLPNFLTLKHLHKLC